MLNGDGFAPIIYSMRHPKCQLTYQMKGRYMDIRKLALEEGKAFSLSRSKERREKYGEIFTPTNLVLEILEQMPRDIWIAGKRFLDPTCGNGQMLAPVAIWKRELGHKLYLATIFGVDLQPDNVMETRSRLLAIAGDTLFNRKIVEMNITCNNAFEYDYKFNESGLVAAMSTEKIFDDLFKLA
jgi:SAM-dependent methyltransferase